ncbi:hypothetical protein, partial [Sphingobacterium sp.]|uniref:hypothetical protein n=1 Tax=Sphingobacterium sp. TaxID=341027 RepID=UPI0028AE8DEB
LYCVLSCTFGFPLPVVLTQEGSRNNAYISRLYWRTFLYLRFPPLCRPDAGRISEFYRHNQITDSIGVQVLNLRLRMTIGL